MNPRRSAAALAAVMLLVACSSDADKGADTTTQTPATAPTDTTVATDSTVPTLAPATFALMPGTEQVAVAVDARDADLVHLGEGREPARERDGLSARRA